MARELVLGVDFDITEAEAKQKELQAKWESQERKIEETANTIKKISDELEKAKNKLGGTKAKSDELKESLKVCEEVLSQTKPNTMAYKLAQEDLQLVKQNIESNKEAQREANAEVDRLQLKLSQTKIKYEEQEAALCKIGAQINKNAQSQEKHNAKSTIGVSSIKNFGKHMLKLAASALIFSTISKALSSMREQIGQMISSSEKFKEQWGKLKGNLQAIGVGLLAPLQPVLEWIMQKLVAISNIMVNIISKITGKSVEDMKKLANNTAKAGKEAKKATAGFDTLQTATSGTSDSSSDSGNVDTSGMTTLSDETMASIAKIMAIIGGALLVIGIILVATGVGVGIGLALMVIGAAMIATALAVAWDMLPTEIQNTIIALLAIVGTAFLVLGAILVFTGANVPLGLALIALGAVMLVAAIALAWETMPEEMRGAIAIIAAIVGVALLVLGAILLFGGVSMPLGFALLAAGAALLIAGVAAKWDELSDEVQAVILVIFGIVSVAALVLGAILLFTGINIPIGLALLLTGILALNTVGGALKEKWNSLSDDIKETIYGILTIVSGALLVLGVILAVFGVIPLGIALIITGIGLIAVAAYNSEDIIASVKNVLNKIKEVFDGFFSNIEGGFKGFINKIIDFINGIIDGLNDFITPIRAVIYGVMKLAGQDVSMDDISIPHIPKLATGAVLPGGKPFAAIVGDQPAGQTNIEAPLDTIKQAVAEVLAEIEPNFTIEATGSMSQLIRLLRLEIKKENKRATVW